jgi:site-specific DNA-methyltransferase (adenine-specific)
MWDAVEGCEHEWGDETHQIYNPQTCYETGRCTEGGWGNDGKKLLLEKKNISQGAFCSKCGAWRGQLGLEPSPQLYIKHLVSIFDEVKRVLKPSGTCWVNIGDSYAGSWGNYGAREHKQRPVLKAHLDRPGVPDDNMVPPTINCGIAPKCLVQIPSRFALAMTDNGWILRNEIIWHKPNCMPSSVKDRFTVDFEKFFFFVKSKRYYFEPQYEPMVAPIIYERSRNPLDSVGSGKGNGQTGGSHAFGCREPRRNKRTVWTISTKPYHGAHFAVFPPELIETPIKAGCPPGGVVLDPFGGSGTTAKVARSLGRSSIIIELNPAYLELATERAMTNVPDVLSFESQGGRAVSATTHGRAASSGGTGGDM